MAAKVALLIFLTFISYVYGGDLTVTHSSDQLRFGSGGVIRTTDLDDILAASLGYTPVQSSPWRGLTITSPFGSPKAAVVVGIAGSGISMQLEGATYGLKEDATLNQVFNRVKNIYGLKAQRQTVFKHLDLNEPDNEGGHFTIPDSKILNISKDPDASFLKEIASLINTANSVESYSAIQHGGQDVFFVELKSLEHLVNTYGLDSPQVNEATTLLRGGLVEVTDLMRRFYDDEVLVIVAIDNYTHTRKTRSILQYSRVTESDLNVNKEYSSDYPAIFNIILWLSIVLALSIVAISVAMATMDPGRDSIIYRMTTMRMKKDN